ncbi:hypothetical protein PF004_g7798 [Phytophthora fragariae]|uniref:Uncharacterized protein n=1 Tax=Phytophthora fragariae TaxID=53985 RepID=A0A6G0P8W4_9STRA|nr:hypothetical protein PF004_g7798 [Phytophthora fragariae]
MQIISCTPIRGCSTQSKRRAETQRLTSGSKALDSVSANGAPRRGLTTDERRQQENGGWTAARRMAIPAGECTASGSKSIDMRREYVQLHLLSAGNAERLTRLIATHWYDVYMHASKMESFTFQNT